MTIQLSPAAGGTELLVETGLSILGKIGEFGQPFIKKKADGLMQEFVSNLEAALSV
jgi:carbon monoxide dehydrogenase subunit G